MLIGSSAKSLITSITISPIVGHFSQIVYSTGAKNLFTENYSKFTGQSVSSIGNVLIEILPRKPHITYVLTVSFLGWISNGTPDS